MSLASADFVASYPESSGFGRSADPSGKAGQIAAEMERRLIRGEYQFGEALSATLIAREFDASRQPVSTAIGHLRSSGYVEVIPQVGCRVVAPSNAEISDFFVALGKIEATAASFAARRFEGDEAAALTAIAQRVNPKELNTAAERRFYMTNLYDYHDQLWAMARTPTLAGRVMGMRRLASFYLWQGMPRMIPTSALLLIQERAEIAYAIGARDALRAEILMEKHIAHKPLVNGLV